MSTRRGLLAPSRRAVIAGACAAGSSLWALGAGSLARAQQGGEAPPPTPEEIAAALPVKTTGLEHFGMTVPNLFVAGQFYSKIFAPEGLHREREGVLRYYVELNPGYIAIGSRPERPPAFIDHFCALAEGYNRAAMGARIAEDGLEQGAYGVLPDPNGFGLQFLAPPMKMPTTSVPATRIVDGPPLVEAHGMDYILLLVNDLGESLEYYIKFFTGAVTRESDPDRIWIEIAESRLGLQQRPAANPPRTDQFGVKVAPFDREALINQLQILGAAIAPDDPKEPDMLRFRDPFGLGVALKPVA